MAWLGSSRLTWHDLRVIVNQSPRTSALYRAHGGQFSFSEQLQVAAVNVLRLMSWQYSGDSRAPKPELIKLPGVDDPEPTLIGDVMSIEEMDRRLEPYKPR